MHRNRNEGVYGDKWNITKEEGKGKGCKNVTTLHPMSGGKGKKGKNVTAPYPTGPKRDNTGESAYPPIKKPKIAQSTDLELLGTRVGRAVFSIREQIRNFIDEALENASGELRFLTLTDLLQLKFGLDPATVADLFNKSSLEDFMSTFDD